jgi:N-acetylneuraminic acid mutarotase
MPAAGGTWETLPPLPGGARQEVGVAEVNGVLFVLGGQGQTGRRLESYDPKANRWETHEMVPIPADHPNVASAAGKLYLLGATGTAATYEYDPAMKRWTQKRPIPTQRAAAAAAGIGTKVYVAGGQGGGSQMLRAFEAYDTTTDTWEALPELPAPGRNHVPGVAVDGIFYVIGGRTGGPTTGLQRRVDAFDPRTGMWSQKAEMPTARGGHGVGVVGGMIIVVGGEGNQAANTGVFPQTELFDPKANTWKALANMKTPRHGMGAAGIDGKLYVPAGATNQGGGTATALLEALTPP